jgi:hypothetical protein
MTCITGDTDFFRGRIESEREHGAEMIGDRDLTFPAYRRKDDNYERISHIW